MNQDKDYELDKWDIILSIAFVITLVIGMTIVGILVYVMLANNSI